MDQIETVVDFLLHYGGYYNRLDRALYSKGDITDDRTEFSCFAVAKLLIRTLLDIDEVSIDSFNISKLYPQLELLYSDDRFPNLIDFSRDGVYCFDTETSFEGHCFVIVKYQNIYYYIGGYGGINEYVIHKLTYSTLYHNLYSAYVEGNSKLYRSFFTNDTTDMRDFFLTNDKKIKSSKLESMSIYYVSDISSFNMDAFQAHFNIIVSRLNLESYYSDIFVDVADCKGGFCSI